jgi:hypothetical protein
VSNDTTGSAGVLFKTLGAPMGASPPPGCTPNPDPTAPQDPSCTGTNAPSVPQPAGLVTMTNTPNMRDALPPNTWQARKCVARPVMDTAPAMR